MKHFLVTVLTDEENYYTPKAVYVVDQNALIMITLLAEQSQAGVLKALIMKEDVERGEIS